MVQVAVESARGLGFLADIGAAQGGREQRGAGDLLFFLPPLPSSWLFPLGGRAAAFLGLSLLPSHWSSQRWTAPFKGGRDRAKGGKLTPPPLPLSVALHARAHSYSPPPLQRHAKNLRRLSVLPLLLAAASHTPRLAARRDGRTGGKIAPFACLGQEV